MVLNCFIPCLSVLHSHLSPYACCHIYQILLAINETLTETYHYLKFRVLAPFDLDIEDMAISSTKSSSTINTTTISSSASSNTDSLLTLSKHIILYKFHHLPYLLPPTSMSTAASLHCTGDKLHQWLTPGYDLRDVIPSRVYYAHGLLYIYPPFPFLILLKKRNVLALSQMISLILS